MFGSVNTLVSGHGYVLVVSYGRQLYCLFPPWKEMKRVRLCVCVFASHSLLVEYGGVSSPCCRLHSSPLPCGWSLNVCVSVCVSSPCSSPALIHYLLFKEPLETSEIERESGICHKLGASRPYCFLTTHIQHVFSIRLFTPTCLWMERKGVQKVWMGKCELPRMTQTAQHCSKQSAVWKCKELKHWLIFQHNARY